MPSPADYLNLSNAIYTLDGTQPGSQGVWNQVAFEVTSSGMKAAAFQNADTGEIVIAYEGTNKANISPSNFVNYLYPQLGADVAIASGQNPKANDDALAFAQEVAQDFAGSPIYVTGHSLGGEEAEYVQANAAFNNLTISGGAAFGGHGVPDLAVSQAAEFANVFTTYLAYGDAIGGYVASGAAQVGNVQYLGNAQDAAVLQGLIENDTTGMGSAAALGMAFARHSLANYADQLGVTLSNPTDPGSDGSPDILTIPSIFGVVPFGGGNAWQPAASPQDQNGSLVVGNQQLTESNGVTDFQLLNSSGTPITLQVVPDGGSDAAGSGANVVLVGGNNTTLNGGNGSDTLVDYGNNGTVNAGTGPTQVLIDGQNDSVNGRNLTVTGTPASSFFVSGGNDAVTLGGVTADLLPVARDINPYGFDPAYYLAMYPDVAASGVDPWQQFLNGGWQEGRNPNAYFDTSWYLAQNPDVAAAGVNPFLHYDEFGWHEGRNPSPLFNTDGYLNSNPDVAAAGVNPLVHYLDNGLYEGRLIDGALPGTSGSSVAADAGGGETIDLAGTGNSLALAGGTGWEVAGSGDTIGTGGGTGLDVQGGGDTVDLGGSGDALGLLGGSGMSDHCRRSIAKARAITAESWLRRRRREGTPRHQRRPGGRNRTAAKQT